MIQDLMGEQPIYADDDYEQETIIGYTEAINKEEALYLMSIINES